MTNTEKLSMIQSAMQTLAEHKELNDKMKQRGLKSLNLALSKYKKVSTS